MDGSQPVHNAPFSPHRRLLPRGSLVDPLSSRVEYAQNHQSRTKRHTRALVSVACRECQTKKCKCDGQRPQCGVCITRSRECHWEVEEGMTRTAALKRGKEKLQQDCDVFQELFDYLQTQNANDALELLDIIRQGASVKQAVDFTRDKYESTSSDSQIFSPFTPIAESNATAKGFSSVTEAALTTLSPSNLSGVSNQPVGCIFGLPIDPQIVINNYKPQMLSYDETVEDGRVIIDRTNINRSYQEQSTSELGLQNQRL